MLIYKSSIQSPYQVTKLRIKYTVICLGIHPLPAGPEVEGRETSFSSRSLLGSSSFMEDVLGGSSLPLNPSLLPFPR